MVAAVVVIVGTGVLACATVVRVALTAAVLIVVAIITLTVAAMAVVVIIVIIIVVAITAVVVTMMVVVVITIVIMIVIVIIVMITMIVVRMCRLVVRACRFVVRRTVVVVVVVIIPMVIIPVVIPYVSRMTLYPIRRGVIHVTRCVPEVMRWPRLVPNHRGGVAVGTHIERTPQYGCRSHRNHSACRRCDIHIVIICGNSHSRTVKPLDSHLVGVVHIVLDVVNVAAVNLRVGGYCGNHRHYNE